jgi:LysM repeat protein
MARGSNGPLRPTLGFVAAPRTRRHYLAAAGPLAAVCVLTLSSCSGRAQDPTPETVPTFIIVTATAGPPPVPTPGEKQIYVVREGDTLSGIAARFGVTEDAILKLNPMTDRNTLYVGQELIIPPAQP